MGPKKKSKQQGCSPAQKEARKITNKYKSKRMSPGKRQRVRRALYSVSNDMSLRKAASDNELSYSFLYRRWKGDVDMYKSKGPATIFTEAEEESMACWLSEMAQRGMGLRMCEFLDFVADLVKKENRKVPFKDGRPGKKWYYAFMSRNSHIISPRSETPLELKRSKVTKEKTDEWYRQFQEFLSSKGLIEKPGRIWNADETGFNMGSNKAKVIGPASRALNCPHITSGKQRLTVMYCGNASGQMMPPFLVFPGPKPKGYNPLNGSLEGSQISYTKKGWMNAETFSKFIDHFDKFAGPDRSVVLLIDSVSSHVDHSVFMKSVALGIEIYRIIPNATHLMQPLDKGVFGPLKSKWHLVARKHTRENPGQSINKETFAQKLTEAFLLFYKPLTVINAFKSSGIYPVDSTVITSDILKPGLTFSCTLPSENQDVLDIAPHEESAEQKKAKGALEIFEETLKTPVRERYHKRIDEGYDVEGLSPCFEVYKKLYAKANPNQEASTSTTNVENSNNTGLTMLADAALNQIGQQSSGVDQPESCTSASFTEQSSSNVAISPVLSESLVFPKAVESDKPVRKTMLNSLPDNLTSPACIRTMSLKQLEKVRCFAEREKKAKISFLKKKSKISRDKVIHQKTGKGPKLDSKRGKGPMKVKKNSSKHNKDMHINTGDNGMTFCKACHMTWEEDQELDVERLWVQCDKCSEWMHVDCLSTAVEENEPFFCPDCETM